MNTTSYTHDDDGGENGPERTDGGYERTDDGGENSVTRRLRSVGILSKSTVADQHVSEFDGDGDKPAIVTWHEMVRQGL